MKLDYFLKLKILYCVVIFIFYTLIFYKILSEKLYKQPYYDNIAFTISILFTIRELSFDMITMKYEWYDKTGEIIGTESEIRGKVIIIVILIFINIAITIKRRKNYIQKFCITTDDISYVTDKLFKLNDMGINAIYEVSERKRKRTKVVTVTFFDVPYKEAVLYAKTFVNEWDSKQKNIIYALFVILILIIDVLILNYRFTNNDYTSLLRLIGLLK